MTTFYEEIDKLRKTDPDGPDGMESNTTLARRLGLTASHLTRYKQGVAPTIKVIRQVVERAGLPESEVWNLFAIANKQAMPDDFPSMLTTVKVPIYDAPIKIKDGSIEADASEYTELAGEFVEKLELPEDMIGLRMNREDDSMTCTIPIGCVIYVVKINWDLIGCFESGAIYAVKGEDGALSVSYVCRVGGIMLLMFANRKYKPQAAWTNKPSEIIYGRVIGFRGDLDGQRAPIEDLDEVTTQLNWMHALRRIWHFKNPKEDFFTFLDQSGISLGEYHAWIVEPGLDLPSRRIEQIIRALKVPQDLVEWVRIGEGPPPQLTKRRGEK